ncbi:MAG: DMT family transporter [Gemmatimonadales bacterium]
MSSRRSLYISMVAVVIFWGGNYSFTKMAFADLPPLAFTAVRFTVGSVILFVLLRRLEPEGTTPRELWGRLILLGVIGNTLYQLCFVLGLARTSATNTALILSAMPTVLTVAAGALGLETILTRQRWALAMATVGVLVVIAARGFAAHPGDWVGDALILAGVGCWTAYSVGIRQLRGAVSALRLTAVTMITGTPGLVLMGIPSLLGVHWAAVPARAWGGLAYSTFLSLVASYILWSRAVQVLGPSRAALFTCLTPLFASLFAMGILGERPTLAHLVGGGLIIGGVLLGNVLPAARTAGST